MAPWPFYSVRIFGRFAAKRLPDSVIKKAFCGRLTLSCVPKENYGLFLCLNLYGLGVKTPQMKSRGLGPTPSFFFPLWIKASSHFRFPLPCQILSKDMGIRSPLMIFHLSKSVLSALSSLTGEENPRSRPNIFPDDCLTPPLHRFFSPF